jgi:hypothetical protein
MAGALVKYPFTEDDWDDVQSFDCGDKPHQREVSDWLKGRRDEDSALAALAKDPPSRIWLYRLEDNEADPGPDNLVGFGALDRSAWRWTGGKDPYLPITILLWFAVQNRFKRQPPGDEGGFYSSQIMDDLIATAMDDRIERPVLGLCVRVGNTGAIDLYRRKGFTVKLSSFKDRATGIEYLRMARVLDAGRAAELVARTKGKK